MAYPRPQMKRENYFSLNGMWNMNGTTIPVPSFQGEQELHYSKEFQYEKTTNKVLLHFDGVDQIAKVYLNDIYIGSHIGGYLPFEFDVTNAIQKDNMLRVEVTDTLDHTYPYGKQRIDRGGMWYTPMSGIWKDVWVEGVPEEYIQKVDILPDLSGVDLTIYVQTNNGQKIVKERIDIKKPIHWTPSNPHLYTHTVSYLEDSVEIYFALRTISIQEIDGVQRVLLNGKPIFLHGVLDQGYFDDTNLIPKENSYKKDIQNLKDLGFNLIRKHIKVESDEFYYLCDKMGMLVIQDFVNSGDYHFFKDTILGTFNFHFGDHTNTLDERQQFFMTHSLELMDTLYSHPSVIGYTIFNEGWGQFNSDYIYQMVIEKDPSRLYDSTSGWFKQKLSDFDSRHIYFRLEKLHPKKKPLFISECGGYSLNLNNTKNTYGYGGCKDIQELTNRIEKLYRKMIIPAIKKGCCGCIYTQVSDIEDEINGLFSSDRTICKVQKEVLMQLSIDIQIELL